jgi:UvrD-like helicase family protein
MIESRTQALETLNPQQREAVLYTEGPLLVIAGAGSGKTRVLTHRVAHLIAEDLADPPQILAITFTNRAATEMKERVEQLVGGRVSRQMWVMTFHSACGRMLRRDAELIGYRSSFTIYDQADQVRLVKNCIEDLGKDPKRFVPRAVHGAISRAKDRLLTAGEYADQIGSFFEQSVAEVYDLYERRMHDANAMDFDDLIMKTVLLLEHVPDARRHWQNAFRYVMVDEYQDTNHAQFKLVSILAEKHTNLAVVGDQDQSIYAFRGADIRNISEFEQDFPNARVIALEQNYRSTQTILDAANSVISHNRDRKPKNLWSDLGSGDPVRVVEAEDEHAEARYVAGRIQSALDEGYGPADIAVFYRMNAQSRVLEDLLTRQSIDYRVVGGPKFYERAEIKDAIAYLQVLDNPADEVSLRRIVNQPRRGIGNTTLDRLAMAARARGIGLWEAVADVEGVGLAAAATGSGVGRRPAGAGARRHRLHGDAGRRAHDRVAGPHREPAGAGGGRPRVRGTRGGGRDGLALRLPAGDLALHRPGRDRRGARPGDADDAAQRQGAGVPGRVRDRARGGAFPPPALARRAQRGGGAQALLRGHDPLPGAADPDLRPLADDLRRPWVQHALPVPRRAARRRGRVGAAGLELGHPVAGRGRPRFLSVSGLPGARHRPAFAVDRR